MTASATPPGTDSVCPWLGLVDDPATHFSFPSTVHRCHADGLAIEPAKQARDCLTAQHIACARYRPPAPAASKALLLPPATTRPPVERVRGANSPTSSPGTDRLPRPRRIVKIGLFVVLLIAVAWGGLAIGSRLAGQLGGHSAGPVGSGAVEAPGSSVSIPPATASSSAVPPGTPSPLPSPTPAATPAPTLSPTPAPLPTPAPTAVVYVVRSGDTLSQIAVRYGVTVAALVTANGLKDPNVITVGQKLVIPAP
jgi:LysM repeat protein